MEEDGNSNGAERFDTAVSGILRRLSKKVDSTKYVMAGMGALALIIINFSANLITSERSLAADEKPWLAACLALCVLSIISGFVRLWRANEVEEQVVRLETSLKLGNAERLEAFDRFSAKRNGQRIRKKIERLQVPFAAVACLAAFGAYCVVVF